MGLINIIKRIGISCCLLLAACDEWNQLSGANEGQVLVKVNDSEITILQYRNILYSLGILTPSDSVKQDIINKLIDRELAVQQAYKQGLDRQPEVILQLEEAKRDVLARAWANQVAASAIPPNEDQIAAYHLKHPELFAQRRIFHLREANFAARLPMLPEIKKHFVEGQTIQQVADWLRSENVPFNEQLVIRAAEQLPIEVLPKLNQVKNSQPVFFESKNGVLVYEVQSSENSPIDWDKAKPIIENYLNKQGGKKAVGSHMLRLRQASTIKYFDPSHAEAASTDEKPR